VASSVSYLLAVESGACCSNHKPSILSFLLRLHLIIQPHQGDQGLSSHSDGRPSFSRITLYIPHDRTRVTTSVSRPEIGSVAAGHSGVSCETAAASFCKIRPMQATGAAPQHSLNHRNLTAVYSTRKCSYTSNRPITKPYNPA
jgi:hypothetical protein